MTAPLTETATELLREPQIAHVATTMPDGSPQITPVWVDTDGEALLFNTAVGRVKHRNLLRDPRVAVCVVDRADPYRTLIVRGRAEMVEAGALEHINALCLKYRGTEPYPLPDGEQRVIVRVVPQRVTGQA